MLEKCLLDAADRFRVNSSLKAQEYSGPIFGLILLRFAEVRYVIQHGKLESACTTSRRGCRLDEPTARFDYPLTLPEFDSIDTKVNDTMSGIEKHNPQLAGVLPNSTKTPSAASTNTSSARFVAEHQENPAAEPAFCCVEKTDETGRLCRLNLAMQGLEGDSRHGGNINSNYYDPHSTVKKYVPPGYQARR